MAGWWLCPQCGEQIDRKAADDDAPEADSYDEAPCMACEDEQEQADWQRKG